MSEESNNKWEEIATLSEDDASELNQEVKASDADSETMANEPVLERAGDLVQSLEAKIVTLEKESLDNKEQALRAVAELENVRRRATRDVENAHKYGVEKLLKELLPVVDSLEQALEAEQNNDSAEASALKQGTELTLSLFLSALSKFSMEPVSPQGEIFDPSIHEAMSMQPNDDVPANTILHVIQKGYLLNGRVVRPARVIVSKTTVPPTSTSIDEKV